MACTDPPFRILHAVFDRIREDHSQARYIHLPVSIDHKCAGPYCFEGFFERTGTELGPLFLCLRWGSGPYGDSPLKCAR